MSAEEASASIAPELNEMHKTVLNARHAAGVPISTVSRHILIPVDDTDVRFVIVACFMIYFFTATSAP